MTNERDAFEVVSTTSKGDEVTITVDFPEGNAVLGLHALYALSKPGAILEVVTQLAYDPSIAKMLDTLDLTKEDLEGNDADD